MVCIYPSNFWLPTSPICLSIFVRIFLANILIFPWSSVCCLYRYTWHYGPRAAPSTHSIVTHQDDSIWHLVINISIWLERGVPLCQVALIREEHSRTTFRVIMRFTDVANVFHHLPMRQFFADNILRVFLIILWTGKLLFLILYSVHFLNSLLIHSVLSCILCYWVYYS